MKIEIKARITGEVLFMHEAEGNTLKITVEAAVSANANLARANLMDADLAGADLAGANLAGAFLMDANLADADLAGANLARAFLMDADLAGANLARAFLMDADLAGAYLARANLADADLAGAYLARANLADADLAGANLARANLMDADLAGANLARANLAGANLARANLARAEQSAMDVPIVADIDAAILAAIDAGGHLDMGSWHKCKTTHCRAGWAITLAGEAGAKLERERGSFIAGCMIYAASRQDKPPPHFFASTEAAMADIKACAAEAS